LSGTVQQQLQELLSAGGASAGVTRNSLLNLPPLAAPGNAVWKQLEDQGIQTIRISAFGIDLNSGRATVRVAVYRHNDSGPARLITQAMQSVESREITAEQAQEIGDDARVEQIATLFSSLGSSQSDLTQALRIGAAMRSAMAKTEAQLQIQLDHILQGRPPGQTATPPDRVTLTSPMVN